MHWYNKKGQVKRKGAYEYNIEWHKNFSSLVIPKVAEAHLIHGHDIVESVIMHEDDYDFYLRTKVPRSSRLVIRDDNGETTLPNIVRYYMSKRGGQLVKIMPPLARKPGVEREISVNKGWSVAVHNVIAPLKTIDYDFYIDEVRKLVDPVKRKV